MINHRRTMACLVLGCTICGFSTRHHAVMPEIHPETYPGLEYVLQGGSAMGSTATAAVRVGGLTGIGGFRFPSKIG